MFLFELALGKKAVIKSINTDNNTKERLHSLGLIKNTEIILIRNTPLGSPKIYQCLNTLIAIRNRTAKQIEIQEIK